MKKKQTPSNPTLPGMLKSEQVCRNIVRYCDEAMAREVKKPIVNISTKI